MKNNIAMLLATGAILFCGCSQEQPQTEPETGIMLLNSTPFPVLIQEENKDPVLVLSGDTTTVDSDMEFGFVGGDCRFELRRSATAPRHTQLICLEVLREREVTDG